MPSHTKRDWRLRFTSLSASGLVEIVISEEKIFLAVSQLRYLEKLVRFILRPGHYIESIEIIHYLPGRMKEDGV